MKQNKYESFICYCHLIDLLNFIFFKSGGCFSCSATSLISLIISSSLVPGYHAAGTAFIISMTSAQSRWWYCNKRPRNVTSVSPGNPPTRFWLTSLLVELEASTVAVVDAGAPEDELRQAGQRNSTKTGNYIRF